MRSAQELFGDAVPLEDPWYVERDELDVGERRLDLHLNFKAAIPFECGACGGSGCRKYDTRPPKAWRHLDFLQYRTMLRAPIPRVTCPSCGVRQAKLPWARERSGFTLAFEQRIAALAEEMPVTEVAEIVDEPPARLRRLLAQQVPADP